LEVCAAPSSIGDYIGVCCQSSDSINTAAIEFGIKVTPIMSSQKTTQVDDNAPADSRKLNKFTHFSVELLLDHGTSMQGNNGRSTGKVGGRQAFLSAMG
jgi:hypothetical protein